MDVIGIDVLIPLAAAVGGLVLGVLFGRTSRRSKARIEELEVRVNEREGQIVQLEAARTEIQTRLTKSEQEREEVSQQLTNYRHEVTGHFTQTSELLKDMTLQYRNIYQHLAQGAEALCPEGTLQLETHAPIEGLAEGDELEEEEPLPFEVPAEDDGDSSVEAAHADPPLQVDPRPDV